MNLRQGTFLQGGKYHIERELGHGGFGVTYLATQVGLNRRVAIKEFFMSEYCERDADTSHVSLGTSGSRETVERFRNKFIKEAQNIAGLKHPNIISIYDVFEDNGTAYYVMEYLDHGSLADVVKRQGRLVEADALRYIHQIADALRYIHARKMNHLDVKPGNILIDENNAAVLIDFGLSKRYDDEGNQTSTTPVGISHGYAPLEQYKKGGVGTFSAATDIYSLGATLYKLVTGSTPPDADVISDDGLPALSHSVSASTANAIKLAMQPGRKKRPQSVEEFLALLDAEFEKSVEECADEENTVLDTKISVDKPFNIVRKKQFSLRKYIWSVLSCMIILLIIIFLSKVNMSTDEIKAAKEAAKALKAEIKAANKVLKEAKGQLNAVDGNINQANTLIQQAMENQHTASNPDTWYTAGKIQEKFYNQENEKMYLQQAYDKEKFFNSLSNMFDYFIKCDELEQIPDEKGKVVVKYRQETSDLLSRVRINLVSGGVTYFNENNNEKAYELFSKYIDVADVDMFKPFNFLETDSLLPEIAYYNTLAGLKLEDYHKALKYVDLAMKKEDVAQKAIEYKAMAYINLGDTANWLNTLKVGVEKYPSVEYFYSNLISYYNDKGSVNELLSFADDMLAKNPLPIFHFVKGFLYQNMKNYESAINEYKVCIEQDPKHSGAYRNLGICYCQIAQDLSDATSNLNIKSKEYKEKKDEITSYYRLALPVYEELRKLDDGTDPDVKNAWTNGLYTCYYMLNMGKEFEEIEKLLVF